MKKFNFIYGAVAAVAMMFASCNLNNQPKFDDADAFVAFNKSAISVDEFGGSVDVPVLLTSLAGLEGTATIEVVDSLTTAKAGVHYSIVGEKSLSFTKDAPLQNLKINVIDNSEFEGDKVLVLNIIEANGANLGANTTCTITFVDDEHPLGFMLGTYSCQAQSNFNDVVEYNVVLEKDAKDINTVWVSNMVPGGTNQKIYGIVNEDRTQVKFPVDQTIATSSSYPSILLKGFYAEDQSEIPTGGYITGNIIEEEGVLYIVIEDFYGSCVFDASGAQLGWYELLLYSVWAK